jgi:hypothetical protein
MGLKVDDNLVRQIQEAEQAEQKAAEDSQASLPAACPERKLTRRCFCAAGCRRRRRASGQGWRAAAGQSGRAAAGAGGGRRRSRGTQVRPQAERRERVAMNESVNQAGKMGQSTTAERGRVAHSAALLRAPSHNETLAKRRNMCWAARIGHSGNSNTAFITATSTATSDRRQNSPVLTVAARCWALPGGAHCAAPAGALPSPYSSLLPAELGEGLLHVRLRNLVLPVRRVR